MLFTLYTIMFFTLPFLSVNGVEQVSCLESVKKTFEKADVLYRHRNLTTLLPMKKAHIREGIKVSLVGKNGHLENATIIQVRGERVEVGLDADPTKRVSLSKNEVFRPITAKKKILYKDENGIDHITRIGDVAEDGSVSLDVFPEGKRIFGEELKLTPREWTKTGGRDLTIELLGKELKEYSENFRELENIYKQEGESENFIEKNNVFMKKIRQFLHIQGVSSSFFKTKRGTLSLEILGVHKEGNRTAKRYMRLLEEQGYLEATFSMSDILKYNALGFYDQQNSRIEFGFGIIFNICVKNNLCVTPDHEIRHLMRHAMQRTLRWSVFDYVFESTVYRGRDLYDRSNFLNTLFKRKGLHYDRHMEFNEIYNHASDIFNMAKILHSRSTPSDLKKTVLRNLHNKLGLLREMSINVKNIVEGLLSRPLNIDTLREEVSGQSYHVLMDSKQRRIFARSSEEMRKSIESKNIPPHFEDEIQENLIRMSRLSSQVLKILEDIEKSLSQGEEAILAKARELRMLVRQEDRLGRKIL